MATAHAVKPAEEGRTLVRPRDRKCGMRRIWLWAGAALDCGRSRVGSDPGCCRCSSPPGNISSRVRFRLGDALGRLAPHGEVIKVAPVSGADGGRVERLLVDVGDWVKAGQVVAILDPYRRREASVLKRSQRSASRGPSCAGSAGPKPEEVQAKEAMIKRSEAEVAPPSEPGPSVDPAETGGWLETGLRR